jgi:hypothetical protein
MKKENIKSPPCPRGLTGPIFRGWSKAHFHDIAPKPVEPMPPAPESPPGNLGPDPATEANPPAVDVNQAAPAAIAAPAEPKPIIADTPPTTTGKTKHRPGTAEDLMALVPPEGAIPKKTLIARWRELFGNHARGRALLKSLVTIGKLFEWPIPRPGTNPEILVSRDPQP